MDMGAYVIVINAEKVGEQQQGWVLSAAAAGWMKQKLDSLTAVAEAGGSSAGGKIACQWRALRKCGSSSRHRSSSARCKHLEHKQNTPQ